jgi:hypothetical protein
MRSSPKLVIRFLTLFLGMLVGSFQMGRNLPQLLLFVRRQTSFYVFGVASNQINTGTQYNVHIDYPGTPRFPRLLAAQRNFLAPPDP